jgi:hypothetical protein
MDFIIALFIAMAEIEVVDNTSCCVLVFVLV